MTTKIEWCDLSWSPITGCTPISEGCANCWAKRMATRLRGRYGYPAEEPFRVTEHWNRLDEPLRWRKRRMAFVVSMGDLFHVGVTEDFLLRVLFFAHEASRKHIMIFLTKREQRMFASLENWRRCNALERLPKRWWIGVTCENKTRADERIPTLLQIPAQVRWVSLEPLLGPIHILNQLGPDKINWVVIGPETGPRRRPCDPVWIEDLVRQCEAAGVPYFIKAFPMPDRISKNMTEWPEWARVRQFPKEVL